MSPNAAAAVVYDSTPAPSVSVPASTRMSAVAMRADSTSVPEHVVRPDTSIGGRWSLRLPLLYDLADGEEGVFASAPVFGAHGYGENEASAVESLLDSMADSLESLDTTPDKELDGSALRLRDQLRKQLHRLS